MLWDIYSSDKRQYYKLYNFLIAVRRSWNVKYIDFVEIEIVLHWKTLNGLVQLTSQIMDLIEDMKLWYI